MNENVWTPLSYDPGLERLVGMDMIRLFQGHPSKSCVLSLARAELLLEVMRRFDESYKQGVGPNSRKPYPVALAVLRLNELPARIRGQPATVQVEQALALPGLSIAPPEYRDLAQMVTIIPGERTLRSTTPVEAARPPEFARRLFELLRCGHLSTRATFCRKGGCCIADEFLTPLGEINDFYYLTTADGLTADQFRLGRQKDLIAALGVVAALAEFRPAEVEQSFVQAIQTYSGRDAASDVILSAREAALSLQNPSRRTARASESFNAFLLAFEATA